MPLNEFTVAVTVNSRIVFRDAMASAFWEAITTMGTGKLKKDTLAGLFDFVGALNVFKGNIF